MEHPADGAWGFWVPRDVFIRLSGVDRQLRAKKEESVALREALRLVTATSTTYRADAQFWEKEHDKRFEDWREAKAEVEEVKAEEASKRQALWITVAALAASAVALGFALAVD